MSSQTVERLKPAESLESERRYTELVQHLTSWLDAFCAKQSNQSPESLGAAILHEVQQFTSTLGESKDMGLSMSVFIQTFLRGFGTKAFFFALGDAIRASETLKNISSDCPTLVVDVLAQHVHQCTFASARQVDQSLIRPPQIRLRSIQEQKS